MRNAVQRFALFGHVNQLAVFTALALRAQVDHLAGTQSRYGGFVVVFEQFLDREPEFRSDGCIGIARTRGGKFAAVVVVDGVLSPLTGHCYAVIVHIDHLFGFLFGLGYQLLRFFGRRRTHDRRGDLFAPVEVVELVVFDNFDEQFGISRIGRIASLFESVSPPFVIHRVQFEQVLVTGRFVEEFRMVVERGLDGRVFAETFAFRIVVVRDRGSGPCALAFDAEENEMEKIMEAVRAIRNRRAEMNVAPSKKAKYFVATADKETFEFAGVFMKRLASASEVEVGDSFDIDGAVAIVTSDAKIYIPMGELIDFEAERARLNKEKDKALKELDFIDKKLNNPGFVSKAPEAVVQGQRDAAAKLRDKVAMLDESIAKLG